MRPDDIIYVTCLLLCIGAGSYVKKLRDETQRKLLCTGLGLLMVFVVSGFHILHCFTSFALGMAAINLVPTRLCHLAAFMTMFGYLSFFRLCTYVGLPDPPSYTNMIQMMLTLKIAGVAFEKTAAWKKLQRREQLIQQKTDSECVLPEITDYDVEVQSISAMEVFCYSFNYIGVLTGPYYRYRTYRDYFETPFKDYASNVFQTIAKLKHAALFCLLYLIANYIWPLEYALSDEFYTKCSFLYRLMYIWPTFFIFRMRMYTGLTLSECVCTMAGFGAYPDEADVANGEGPRKQYMQLKRDADQRSYNFTTIINQRVKDVEVCWTFREAMKHWNICVQYWLAVNVYKLFPSKRYRTAATLLCSAYWHGFRPGHYMCIMGAPFYVPLEDMWNKLVRLESQGIKRCVIDIIFWIAKFFAFSYLGTAFLLVSFKNIWKYYGSVYHIGYITWAIMFSLGMVLAQSKRGSQHRNPVDKRTGGIAGQHTEAKRIE